MKRPRLELLVIERADGADLLASPAAGRVRWSARTGATLVHGSVAGTITTGERVFDLVLPSGVVGQIREVLADAPLVPCGYRSPLAVLGAVEAAPLGAPETGAGASRLWEIRAPSHGTFYRRSGPDTPPYIQPGADIARGAIVGLVEVMKCFSPILFEPPGDTAGGTVREILVGDREEVRSDQVLARVELS